MKNPHPIRGMLAIVSLLAVVGCATPESRIRKNPELFDRLAPEVQAEVRLGRIDIGFPSDAVLLALGQPERKYTRRAAAGKTLEVWSYTSTQISHDRQRAEVRIHAYDRNGQPRVYTDSTWVEVEQRTEYERQRVEFEGGVVSAIETVER